MFTEQPSKTESKITLFNALVVEDELINTNKAVMKAAKLLKETLSLNEAVALESQCRQIFSLFHQEAKAIIINRSVGGKAQEKLLQNVENIIAYLNNHSAIFDMSLLLERFKNIFAFLKQISVSSDYDDFFDKDVQKAIAISMPADSKEDIKYSLRAMRALHQNSKLYLYEFIAKWIENKRIPLVKVPLDEKEFCYVAPQMRYLDLTSDKEPLVDNAIFKNVTNLIMEKSQPVALSYFSKLLSIKFVKCNLCDLEGLPTSLKEINFISCENFTPAAIDSIKGIHSIEQISFSLCKNISPEILKSIYLPQNITKIEFSHREKGMQEIVLKNLFSPFQNIKSLDVSFCEDVQDEMFDPFLACESISELCISNCFNVTNLGVKKILTLKNLKKLDISHNSKINFEGFTKPHEDIVLESLNLACCKELNDKAVDELCRFTTLSHLDLSGCFKMTNQALVLMKSFKNLEVLSIKGWSKVDDSGFESLSFHKKLKKLDAANCMQITDRGVSYFRNLKELEEVNLLACSGITSVAISYLEGLKKLKCLVLAGCKKLSDQALCHMGKIQSLEKVDISACDSISDEGILHLNTLRLKEIDLSDCSKITTLSLKYLSQHNDLKVIKISSCHGISDECVSFFEMLKNLENVDISQCRNISLSAKKMIEALINPSK